MKLQTIIFGLCLCVNVHAQEIFNDYESFYRSLPNRLFTKEGKDIPAKNSIVWINQKRTDLMKSTAVPEEPIFLGDVGNNPTLYQEKNYFCVEGIGATSGTASRHIAVYLIDRKNKRQFKLPSLFSSCLSIGKTEQGRPTFFEAKIINYRAAYDADGVRFIEYVIDKNRLKKTENEIETTFIRTKGFYKFTVEKNDLERRP
jgi:hypothetical protein